MGKTANIKFNGGIIHTPSDVSPVDGDLNECINLVPSDGELKPLEMPQKIFPNGGVGGVVAAIHKGTWGKHFIKVNNYNNTIWFLDENMLPIEPRSITFESKIKWVQCLGTYVIVGTDSAVEYIVYKNGVYRLIGQSVQSPDIEFYIKNGGDENLYKQTTPAPSIDTSIPGHSSVNGLPVFINYFNNSLWIQVQGNYYNGNSHFDVVWQRILDNITAKINKAYTDMKKDSRFCYPFFIRYAIKLKTGDYVGYSRPILIVPSSEKNPIVMYYANNGYVAESLNNIGVWVQWNPVVELTAFNVYFKFSQQSIDVLKSLEDLIEGVEVFMTSPLYTHKESNMDINHMFPNASSTTQYRLYPKNYIVDAGTCLLKNEVKELLTKHTQNRNIQETYNLYNTGGQLVYTAHIDGEYGFELPVYDLEEQKEALLSNGALFYKVKSLTIDDIIAMGCGEQKLTIKEEVLNNLETQLQMPNNDFHSAEIISYECANEYNGRLVVANESTSLQKHYKYESGSSDIDLKFVVLINEQRIVHHVQQGNVSQYLFGSFIFYPYTECSDVYVRIDNKYYKCHMRQHPSLTGSYFYCGYQPLKNANVANVEYLIEITQGEYEAIEPTSTAYSYNNILKLSNFASPMAFDVNNMVEIGKNNIICIATNTIPMSEGQYGQFPLVVFTDSGIYAIGVVSDGTLGSVSLVSSSDTLMGSPGLGQPNVISDGQSLYFITKRGLMEMRGLQVRCVSEVLNGGTWKYSDYRDCVNPNQGKVQYQNIVMLFGDGIKNSQTFNQAISNPNNPAFLAFDYKHNRILVTNPSLRAHWLYSITDHKWCKLIFNDNYKVDDKSAIQNICQMMSSGLINVKNPNDAVDGRDIVSAVFDWNASYLQTSDGELWDLMGAPDENDDAYYKYGFIASRPIRLGSDEHKSIIRLLHRERINSQYGFRGMRLYGSVDGIRFYEITSLHGASYKYFVVLLYTCMKANERYSYMSVEFEERFQNKLR